VPDVEWNCQDGEDCPSNISSDDAAPVLGRNRIRLFRPRIHDRVFFECNGTTFPIPEREKKVKSVPFSL
jgi:hypothetical protein